MIMLFRWCRWRRWCGNGGGAKDEGNVGAAPWRWRTGWLNRQDDQIDDGSSCGTVDEGRQGVVVDDVVGEEAPAGWRTEEGVGASRVLPASVYEWVGGWDGSGEPWLRDALVRNVR